MSGNCYFRIISAVCLVLINVVPLLSPTAAFSLSEECVVEGTEDSLVQSGHETFVSSDGDRLALDPADFKVFIDSPIYEYTGDAISPEVSVSAVNGSALTSGIDYEVIYLNNIAPGRAAISVNGLCRRYSATTRRRCWTPMAWRTRRSTIST